MSNAGGPIGLPQLGADFTDTRQNADGTFSAPISIPWYRFLLALWQLVGGSQVPILQALYFVLVGPQEINAYSVAAPNGLVGTLRLKDQPGADEVAQTLTTSPFSFVAGGDGTFIAFSCMIEVKRNAGFHKVSLTGGAVPLMKDDTIKLTWTGPTPSAVWFPMG